MEKKIRKCFLIYPKSEEKIQSHLKTAACDSASEFIEKAINFYCGYLDSLDDSEYLPKVLLGGINGSMDVHFTPVNRNLFKIAVELDLLSNLLASTLDIDMETIARARGSAVDRVKHINGIIGYETAHKNQHGDIV